MEAVTTLTVLAGTIALGAPSLVDAVQSLRLQAVAGNVFEHLLLARSEAIKRNGRVVLCKSADGSSCSEQGTWRQGWILFHDRNNNGTHEPDEPLLPGLPPLPPDFRLRANAPLEDYVSYGPTGTSRLTSGAFQAGTFTVCRASVGAVEGREIIINAGGRPRVQKVLLDSCF